MSGLGANGLWVFQGSAGRALVAALEVIGGPRRGELLFIGVHGRKLLYEPLSPRTLEDDLAFAAPAVPVHEDFTVLGDVVGELFLAHRSALHSVRPAT